jgi:hypothetical protein
MHKQKEQKGCLHEKNKMTDDDEMVAVDGVRAVVQGRTYGVHL